LSLEAPERQISWVTRASVDTIDKRRTDYAQLMNQVAPISQLTWLNGQRRELLRLSRTQIPYSSGIDFSHDARFTETVARGVSYAPAAFAGDRPSMSISVAHSGFDNGITVADIDLRFLSDFLGDAQDRGEPPRLRYGRAMGRRRPHGRSAAQGLQSSGAGDGDPALARGGRQRRRRDGGNGRKA
jgi:hypothetical protein